MIYTVTLNPALDYTMKINEVSADIQCAQSSSITYGGKGINVSVVLKNLGIKSVALGFEGGHTGEKLKNLLTNEGINFDFTKIDDDTRINVKITGTQNITVNARGPQITLNDEQKLLKKIKNINSGDWLILSGSIPPSMGALAYERIMAGLENKKINLVADTTGQAMKSILKYNPFLIKPNNFELEELFGKTLKDDKDVIECAVQLQKFGAKNVLVSMGKRGMILLDENANVFSEPIFDGTVKNTIGCGDSSVAGFVAGYLQKQDYKYALKLASACANATAFSNHLATKSEIEKLL